MYAELNKNHYKVFLGITFIIHILIINLRLTLRSLEILVNHK